MLKILKWYLIIGAAWAGYQWYAGKLTTPVTLTSFLTAALGWPTTLFSSL